MKEEAENIDEEQAVRHSWNVAVRRLDWAHASGKAGHHDFSVIDSYYAAYHAADAALDTNGIEQRSHGQVAAHFGNLCTDNPKQLGDSGKRLIRLKAARGKANYNKGAIITSGMAEQAFDDAHEVVKSVDTFLRDRRPAIEREAVPVNKDYIKDNEVQQAMRADRDTPLIRDAGASMGANRPAEHRTGTRTPAQSRQPKGPQR